MRIKRHPKNLPPEYDTTHRGKKILNTRLDMVGFIAWYDTITKEVMILYPPKPKNPQLNSWSAGTEQRKNLKWLRR